MLALCLMQVLRQMVDADIRRSQFFLSYCMLDNVGNAAGKPIAGHLEHLGFLLSTYPKLGLYKNQCQTRIRHAFSNLASGGRDRQIRKRENDEAIYF